MFFYSNFDDVMIKFNVDFIGLIFQSPAAFQKKREGQMNDDHGLIPMREA